MRQHQVLLVVLVSLGLGALLGSSSLVGLAERQPIGPRRSAVLHVAESVDRVANFLSLNRPADALAAALTDDVVYDVDALIEQGQRARAATSVGTESRADGRGAAQRRGTAPTAQGESDAGRISDADDRLVSAGEDPAGAVPAGADDRSVRVVEEATDENQDAQHDGGDVEIGSSMGEEPGGDEGGLDGPAVGAIVGAESGALDGDGRNDPEVPDAESSAVTEIPGTGAGVVPGRQDPGSCDPGASGGPGDSPPGPNRVRLAPGDRCPADVPTVGGIPVIVEPMPSRGAPEFVAPRAPVPSRPLSMYVWGDSMTYFLGQGLARIAPVDLVELKIDDRRSTGLSRPDFFDWPQQLARVIAEEPVDVFVVMLGTNDYQSFEHEDRLVDRSSDEWIELYAQRVDRVMALLGQPRVQTVWVGMPPLREGWLAAGVPILNEVFAEQAENHPHVTFVDVWEHFTDEEGGYADEIDGVRLRSADGIHLTATGSDRLARLAFEPIASAWGIS